jgi:hypothetical protein
MSNLHRTAGAAAAALIIAAPAAAQELALKRVLLSSGGVAYFEHEAAVEGDAELTHDVRLDQVDDVLKSIVVFDDVGGVGAIRLPGREPLAQLFRDLPFGPEALESPVRLLARLKGAEVSVEGARGLAGRLIGVEAETVRLPDDAGSTVRHRVSLATATGIRQFVLEEADSIRFDDPTLQAQVQTALEGISRHRVRDRRTLTIDAPGAGRRTVRVGYVVAAPLWKGTYRLSLAGDGKTGHLQGWAVVENMSGHPWNGVELTLASGNPVTFRQALYTAYYVDRPEVPVEVLGRVLPPPDTGAVPLGEREAAARLRAAAEPQAERKAATEEMEIGAVAADMMAAPAEAPVPSTVAQAAAAAAEEATTQVTFRVAEPITVGAGESVLVAVIDTDVPASPVALYQPAVHARHPLAAARLDNTTGTGLPPGVLTLYERGAGGANYVGDARLAPLPSGDSRLLSFALDQNLLIDRETDSESRIVRGAISRGLLRLSVRQREATTYRIKSSAKEARTLVIEHPRRAGWELVEPEVEEPELTETAYRLPSEIAAGASRTVVVALERTTQQQVAIADMTRDRMVAYAGMRELSPEVRRAFERLAELRAEVERHRTALERIEQDRNVIYQDQERLRDNLGRVPRDSDLYQRYLDKLSEEENRLDALALEADREQTALEAAESALADAIAKLDV